MLLKYCFGVGTFCGCFQGFFLWYHGTKAGNRYYSIRISAYPDTGRHISLILLILMLASLSISRIVALIPWLSASMPLGSMPGQLRKTSGIHIPPVPHVWPLAGCTNQTTGTYIFHTIVIGSSMKIILSTHYRLSFVLAHCKLIALNKAAHIRLLHSIMWRIFYTFSGLFLTCLPHYKLTDAGFTVFCLWCMFLP